MDLDLELELAPELPVCQVAANLSCPSGTDHSLTEREDVALAVFYFSRPVSSLQ